MPFTTLYAPQGYTGPNYWQGNQLVRMNPFAGNPFVPVGPPSWPAANPLDVLPPPPPPGVGGSASNDPDIQEPTYNPPPSLPTSPPLAAPPIQAPPLPAPSPPVAPPPPAPPPGPTIIPVTQAPLPPPPDPFVGGSVAPPPINLDTLPTTDIMQPPGDTLFGDQTYQPVTPPGYAPPGMPQGPINAAQATDLWYTANPGPVEPAAPSPPDPLAGTSPEFQSWLYSTFEAPNLDYLDVYRNAYQATGHGSANALGPETYGTGDWRPTGVDPIDNAINDAINNPVTTAINFGTGFIPIVGQVNTISNLLGGPTVGGMLTGAVQGLTDGGSILSSPNEIIPLEESLDPVGDILNSDDPYGDYMDWINENYEDLYG